MQVYLNSVTKQGPGCCARVACKLELMQPCCRCGAGCLQENKRGHQAVQTMQQLMFWSATVQRHYNGAYALCMRAVTASCQACKCCLTAMILLLLLLHRSVKDRIAYAMIEAAEQQGLISPGQTVLVSRTGRSSSSSNRRQCRCNSRRQEQSSNRQRLCCKLAWDHPGQSSVKQHAAWRVEDCPPTQQAAALWQQHRYIQFKPTWHAGCMKRHRLTCMGGARFPLVCVFACWRMSHGGLGESIRELLSYWNNGVCTRD